MPMIIDLGKEFLRICPSNPQKLEVSLNGGRSWMARFASGTVGNFTDLTVKENKIFATASKGFFYSVNGGRSWIKMANLK